MCAQELPAALRLALNAGVTEAEARGEPLDPEVLCGPEELHRRIESTTGLRYVPSEELDAAAQRFVSLHCRGQGPTRRRSADEVHQAPQAD